MKYIEYNILTQHMQKDEKNMRKRSKDIAEYRCSHVIYFVNSLIHGRGLKQSGPNPLLKLLHLVASCTSSIVNGETLTLLLESILICSSSSTLKSMSSGYCLL